MQHRKLAACAERTTHHRIRLAEIDTSEVRTGAAEPNQALASRVSGETVRVEIEMTDRYGRKGGKVWLGDRDVNREMLREGLAWEYRRYLRDRSLLEHEEWRGGWGEG